MYRYTVTKIWYDEDEVVESETPLTEQEIRNQVDENRMYCDEIVIEEESED